jgi:hypothetical protein
MREGDGPAREESSWDVIVSKFTEDYISVHWKKDRNRLDICCRTRVAYSPLVSLKLRILNSVIAVG